MRLTVCQEWRWAIDSHGEQGRSQQRSWSSPMDPGLGVVADHSTRLAPQRQDRLDHLLACGRHRTERAGQVPAPTPHAPEV